VKKEYWRFIPLLVVVAVIIVVVDGDREGRVSDNVGCLSK
jgi:hypothetical protein